MPDGPSRNGTSREEWDALIRSVNAGFLRRWNQHDPRGPALTERPASRPSRPPKPAPRPRQLAVR
jgi:hypothetical protein